MFEAPHLDVSIPGEVRQQLVEAGRLADPFVDQNFLDQISLEANHWWYGRTFDRPTWDGGSIWLVFEGIDCRSEVFLNGRRLGGFEGMYAGPAFDISKDLRDHNELMVHVLPAETHPELAEAFWRRGVMFEEDLAPQHRYLKPPMLSGSNGFPPRVITAGIWLPVRLERRGALDLMDVWITCDHLSDDQRSARVTVHIQAHGDGERVLRLRWRDPAGRVRLERQIECVLCEGRVDLSLEVEDPLLWWPNGHGPQHRYNLEASLDDGPVFSRPIALRKACWVPTPGTDKRLTLEVNGKPIYAGGASWAGGDRTLRCDPEAYRWYLSALRDANTTFMRVWGGLPREPRFFYDLCETFGILITQDFQLANYANNPDVLSRIDPSIYERQVRQALHDLRGYGCIVGWIAGNELRADEVAGSSLSPVIDRAERAVVELDPDPDRVWRRSSYELGSGWTDEYGHYGRRQPQTDTVTEILDAEPGFAIEYFAGPHHAVLAHDPQQVSKFLPEAVVQWPPPSWLHLRRINGAPWNQGFVEGSLPIDVHPGTAAPYRDWPDLAYWSQAFAAANIEAILGNWRARGGAHAGSNLWHSHDQYPTLSWGLLDFEGAPKAMYYAMKRGLSPVRVAIKYTRPQRDVRDPLRGWVRVINDSDRPLVGHAVHLHFYDHDLREVMRVGPDGTVVRPCDSGPGNDHASETLGSGRAGQAHHAGLPTGTFQVPRAATSQTDIPSQCTREVFQLGGIGYLFPYYQLEGLPDTSEDAALGQPPCRRFFGILARLVDADDNHVAQTFYPYNCDWHHSAGVLAMTKTRVDLAFEGWNSDGTGWLGVTNRGARLCPWVELFANGLSANQFTLSDNFIPLRSGECREIRVKRRDTTVPCAAPDWQAYGMNLSVPKHSRRIPSAG